MKRTQMITLGLVSMCVVVLVGCQLSEEEMAAMMEQPPRPAELDRLEAELTAQNEDVNAQTVKAARRQTMDAYTKTKDES